jgi:hypothetical protein
LEWYSDGGIEDLVSYLKALKFWHIRGLYGIYELACPDLSGRVAALTFIPDTLIETHSSGYSRF